METKDLIVMVAASMVLVSRQTPLDAVYPSDAGGAGSRLCDLFRQFKTHHGGLRYLEHYEFRLVSEALANVKCY